jgi:hypothetical protein
VPVQAQNDMVTLYTYIWSDFKVDEKMYTFGGGLCPMSPEKTYGFIVVRAYGGSCGISQKYPLIDSADGKEKVPDFSINWGAFSHYDHRIFDIANGTKIRIKPNHVSFIANDFSEVSAEARIAEVRARGVNADDNFPVHNGKIFYEKSFEELGIDISREHFTAETLLPILEKMIRENDKPQIKMEEQKL